MAGQVCARGGRGHDCARAHRLDWSHVLTTPLSSYAPMLRVIVGTEEIVLQISIINPDTSACNQTPPPGPDCTLVFIILGILYIHIYTRGGTWKFLLGPRGPLVLPSVGSSVPSARKIWITYIQAYMPYES